jgi:predicted acetyltransferase
MKYTLIAPGDGYQASFLEGAAEFKAQGRLDSTYAVYLGYNLDSLHERFAQFTRDLNALGDESRVASGWYVDIVMWLVAGKEYVGQASLRPELTSNYLIQFGGHIGYSIRPTKRRRGFGEKILALALQRGCDLGLHRVLITCDSDNVASQKIIERNGGTFESAMPMDSHAFRAEGRPPNEGVTKLRYWIDLVPVEVG